MSASDEVHPAFRAPAGLTDWAREVLNSSHYATMTTVRPDGSPHSVPVGFVFDGHSFFIPSGSATGKVRNLKADARARVLIEARVGVTGLDDGWVAADGLAHVVGGDEARQHNRGLFNRYLTEAGKQAYERFYLPLLDVTIVVTPHRWQSWDESGVNSVAADHGYTDEDIAGWYLQ